MLSNECKTFFPILRLYIPTVTCLEIPKIEKHIPMYNIHGLYGDQNISVGKIDVLCTIIRSTVF